MRSGWENALAFQISGGAKGGRDSVVPVVHLSSPDWHARDFVETRLWKRT